MLLLFGFKTQNRRETPAVLYCGENGNDLAKALDPALESKEAYVRFAKSVHPPLIPVTPHHAEKLQAEINKANEQRDLETQTARENEVKRKEVEAKRSEAESKARQENEALQAQRLSDAFTVTRTDTEIELDKKKTAGADKPIDLAAQLAELQKNLADANAALTAAEKPAEKKKAEAAVKKAADELEEFSRLNPTK